ncbi:MAG: hypothetical protein C0407_03855 [Desulfobacca sp.]|nr:hypothetical protein [Desulfobacca sp.]
MRSLRLFFAVVVVGLWVVSGTALAQQVPYGPNINLATAKMVAAGAAAEAVKMKLNIVIAIVDTGGRLVYLERFDTCQYGSIKVAVHKAKSAAAFKRPTKVFEDLINGGKPAFLNLDGASAIEGGLPLLQEGKIIGAIGISGGSAAQDGVVATAGAKEVK